jgi:hypothetical protein
MNDKFLRQILNSLIVPQPDSTARAKALCRSKIALTNYEIGLANDPAARSVPRYDFGDRAIAIALCIVITLFVVWFTRNFRNHVR